MNRHGMLQAGWTRLDRDQILKPGDLCVSAADKVVPATGAMLGRKVGSAEAWRHSSSNQTGSDSESATNGAGPSSWLEHGWEVLRGGTCRKGDLYFRHGGTLVEPVMGVEGRPTDADGTCEGVEDSLVLRMEEDGTEAEAAELEDLGTEQLLELLITGLTDGVRLVNVDFKALRQCLLQAEWDDSQPELAEGGEA